MKELAMINLDDELTQEYLRGCYEHLDTIEASLLAMEKGDVEIEDELVLQVFRAVHSIKGGAVFFDLLRIRELANQIEEVVALMRSHEMVSTPDRVRILLRAHDKLRELVLKPDTSNQADITEISGVLAGLLKGHEFSTATSSASPVEQAPPNGGHLRMLLAEDDFASRLLLQTFLSRYGECHVAVNGREAVAGFRYALERGERYDLICMDIMMPELDGREAVRQVRALEEAHGILSTHGAKIIMTTAVDDVKEVFRCFKELCDSYLIKPIALDKLLGQMKLFKLIS